MFTKNRFCIETISSTLLARELPPVGDWKRPIVHLANLDSTLDAWKDFNISKWTDLLKITFNLQKTRLYEGEEGLEEAMKRLREIKEENGKNPTTKTKGAGGIYKAVRRGEWAGLGIVSWGDLIKRTFENDE